MTLIGRYFDGHGSHCHDVVARFDGAMIELESEGFSRRYSLRELSVSEPSRSRPRVLSFVDGSRCELPSTPQLSEELARLGFRDSAAVRGQRNPWLVGVSAMLLIAAVVAAYVWGIPVASRLAARWTPAPMVEALDREALTALDAHLFQASAVDPERQQRLQVLLDALMLPSGDERSAVRLHFRAASSLGPNALALPGGSIVLLDELLAVSGDRGVQAVLAHELGHVELRHSLDWMYRNAAAGALAAWVFGDISALAVLLPTVLVGGHYSREMEREADEFALLRLSAIGADPATLPEVLSLLFQRQGRSGGHSSGYLDSHPAPDERLMSLRARASQLNHSAHD